jgi:hypothetical protein
MPDPGQWRRRDGYDDAGAAIIRWQVQTAGLGTLASCSSAQNPGPQGSPPRLGISPESRQ